MGWSYRKSFGSGPFRINFSKRGISYSVGMKGGRVNFGPRGTYVNLSSHGISYRRKIGDAHHHSTPVPQQTFNPVLYHEPHNISSADIGQLTDTDSKDFVSELTKKSGQIAYTKWFGVFPLVAFTLLMLFTSFKSQSTVTRPASDSIVARITSQVGVYIRKSPNSRSGVLRAAAANEHLLLLDSSNRKWLKVSTHDSVGYVGERFWNIEHIHHDAEESVTPVLSNPYAGYEFGLGLIVFIFWIIRLKKIDKRRFEISLHYEMDESFEEIYRQFGEHFATFTRSAKIWQYLNTERTFDAKRNAGAGNLIRRTPVSHISTDKAPAEHFITNVAVPYIRLTNIELYFLPERLLVKQRGVFAAVFYKNLHLTRATTRFIEEESLAPDAQVVDRTWRYVNKSGGPDRRFNDNRQLPICTYSEYTLKSDTGIYEVREDLDERKMLLADIERQETMLSNARKQIAAGEIDADDFKAIKADCNKALMLLEDKLSNLPNKGDSLKTIENLLDMVIVKFSDIQGRFKRAPIAEKRKLIGSIYPKNLCFDGTGHRTPYINQSLSLIMQINSQLQAKKKGEKYTKCDFSPLVARRGIF